MGEAGTPCPLRGDERSRHRTQAAVEGQLTERGMALEARGRHLAAHGAPALSMLLEENHFITRDNMTAFRLATIADAYGREAESLAHAVQDGDSAHSGNTDSIKKLRQAELHSFAFRCAAALINGIEGDI